MTTNTELHIAEIEEVNTLVITTPNATHTVTLTAVLNDEDTLVLSLQTADQDTAMLTELNVNGCWADSIFTASFGPEGALPMMGK